MSDMGLVDIVLVEDSPADAEMTLRVLRKNNLTNRIVWFKDGVEALGYLLPEAGQPRPTPKLVLLDIKMPRLDGIEVLRRMKHDPEARLVPVVMLTSSAEDRDLRACYELGVNSYVVKPVEFGAFATVVAQAGLYWAAVNQVAQV